MNVVMFIDYANLYHNMQNIYDTNDSHLIEDKICECINKTCDYMKTMYKNKVIHVVGKKAYILPDKVYGQPEQKLKQKSGIIVQRVKEDMRQKDAIMKEMEQSRADDRELAKDVLKHIQNDQIHGVIIVSNDNDFEEAANNVRYLGKSFFAGIVEAKCARAGKRVIGGSKVKNISDQWIPMYDILENKDEGEALDCVETVQLISGPRLDIYKQGELIISYPVNKNIITIGRRSLRKRHNPHIDLTSYDLDKVISRKHGEVCRLGEKLIFTVHKECSRGTWLNTKVKRPGEQFVLEKEVPIVLGAADGFVMYYTDGNK